MNELQIFENYRCLYHQVQFLNSLIKQNDQEQKLNIHNHILNRVKQILNLKDQNYMRMQEILTLNVINCLEDILKLESSEIRLLYSNIKILVEYLIYLNEFISQQAQQVLLGDVVIDIQLMNKQIEECIKKCNLINTKHKHFFEEYNELQEIISKTTNNINESSQLLIAIIEEIKEQHLINEVQRKCQSKNEDTIKNLELQLLE
ncbi:unnamed protein product (macronuclear) [Paramecium tetraurelia]|uniref:Uncharacterized protein n=1 Tax=Paramecium tetraurelia TaxID=5888 RepID=A0BNT8_PARTE|nr:uncharacterized protein GSPATT00030844001 [Paramecium tetraurelia]CAK60205.1 unnamed protein product [Paramecium tetraurelia]|eukprot:XP_001427603.1 hypothetical protein (macronuclear) [Paramecium tetraurelia strain d4-2]